MSKVAALKTALSKLSKTAAGGDPTAENPNGWLTGASDEHLDSKRKLFDSAIKDSHEVLHDGGNVDQDALRAAIRNMRLVDAEIQKRSEAKSKVEQRQKIEQQPDSTPAAPAAPAAPTEEQQPAPAAAAVEVAKTATHVATETGYYFYDTADGSIYPEGGKYNTFAEISKVDSKSFYQHGNGEAPDEVDDSLMPCYVNDKGQVFSNLHVNPNGGVSGKRIASANPFAAVASKFRALSKKRAMFISTTLNAQIEGDSLFLSQGGAPGIAPKVMKITLKEFEKIANYVR
jgi:hypothetical protein